MQGSELLVWLRGVLGKLLPRQTMRGDAGVQVGKVGGDVHVVHETHHHYGGHQRGAVALSTTPEQRAVLALMRTLPERPLVLEFMRREFGTKMVNELEPAQLYRVRRYVEKINETRGVER